MRQPLLGSVNGDTRNAPAAIPAASGPDEYIVQYAAPVHPALVPDSTPLAGTEPIPPPYSRFG